MSKQKSGIVPFPSTRCHAGGGTHLAHACCAGWYMPLCIVQVGRPPGHACCPCGDGYPLCTHSCMDEDYIVIYYHVNMVIESFDSFLTAWMYKPRCTKIVLTATAPIRMEVPVHRIVLNVSNFTPSTDSTDSYSILRSCHT